MKDERIPASVVVHEGTTYFLVRRENGEKRLVVQGDAAAFRGEASEQGLMCVLTAENAAALRARLP